LYLVKLISRKRYGKPLGAQPSRQKPKPKMHTDVKVSWIHPYAMLLMKISGRVVRVANYIIN
jgi:hypothetical protein